MYSTLRIPQTELDEILLTDPNLWKKLRRARLFLTGGSGFFGRWILESILRANDCMGLNISVVALVRNAKRFFQSAPYLSSCDVLRLVEGDIRSFDFPEGEFSYIVHLATSSDAAIQAADPFGLFTVIVNGTGRVLEFANKCKARRFLFVSSGAVYGPQPAELTKIPEDYRGAADCTNPQSVYSTAKRASEQLCGLYNSTGRIAVSIARPFAFIGPGMPLNGHFAAGNFIRDGIAGAPIKITGDGTPLRSYLYSADLALWLWKILLDGTPGRAYNVGGKEIVSIQELAQTVANCFSPSLSIITGKRPDHESPPERYIPDISRAEKELGLSVRIPLKEALQRTISWYSNQ